MNFRKRLIAAAAAFALALATLIPSAPVYAAAQILCAPDVSGAVRGARRVTVTSSTAATQPVYNLNGQGCALIQLADIGFFLSQGFSTGPAQSSLIFNTGVATGTTNFVVGTLPAKAYIQQIIFSNSVAAAVTGGISIGTTANGAQIVTAQAVGASTDVATAQAAILLPVPVTTGLASTINMAAVTAWNNANVTVTVIYGYY